MTDILLHRDSLDIAADLSVVRNDLATDDGLETAVLLSLFLDRRAEDGDDLPAGSLDRRGWWADAFPVVSGDRIGSRLWLLDRSKGTPDVLSRAETYAREALAWLLEDSVADRIDVAAERTTSPDGFALTISVYRPRTDPAKFRFGRVWAAEEARL